MALREKFGAELPALAHDHVRVPALDEITEGGQLGANVEPGEELLIITRCALSMSNSANPPISGIHSSREGSSTGEREAETLDVAPELTLSRDENVVPGPKARLRERSQRPDVTRAPAGCEEDAHAGRKERTTGLEPATPSLGSEDVPLVQAEYGRDVART